MKKETMLIDEIIRLAFAKYVLSHSKKSMNTFIFTQYKNNHLSDEELERICNILDIKITEFEEKKKQKADEEMKKEIENIINLKLVK